VLDGTFARHLSGLTVETVFFAASIFECAQRLHTEGMTNMAEVLNIQQAAQLSGVSAHTLRYYERIGLLEGVQRTASGYREYDQSALGRIRFLTMLRDTGMSIQQMLEFTALERSGEASFGNRYRLLQAHRAELMTRMARLQEHLKYLDEKVEYYWRLEQRQLKKVVSTAS
jgi:DNA-binding transcriptional MerR regulator